MVSIARGRAGASATMKFIVKFLLAVLAVCHFGAAMNAEQEAKVRIRPHSLSLLVGRNSSFNVSVECNSTGVVHFLPTSAKVANFTPTCLNYSQPSSEMKYEIFLSAVGPGEIGIVFPNDSLQPSRLQDAILSVVVYKSEFVSILAEVVGWIYFVAWTVSFYPQIYTNWRRRSVVGLSFDFVALNTLGFFCYSLYNVAFLFLDSVVEDYLERNPGGFVQVQVNDAAFSLHALFACIVTGVQCLAYERGSQRLTPPALGLLSALSLFVIVSAILAASSVMSWLLFFDFTSYVKLVITCTKYVPQAYMNFRRKSTKGWSIGNILLDFTGGVLSILQMVLLSYNQDAWGSILGDPVKIGLGLLSICFDVLFMLQHYVFYRNKQPYVPIAEQPPQQNLNTDGI